MISKWNWSGVTIKPRPGIGWIILEGDRVVGHAGSLPSALDLAAIVVAEKLSEEDCENEDTKSVTPANAG